MLIPICNFAGFVSFLKCHFWQSLKHAVYFKVSFFSLWRTERKRKKILCCKEATVASELIYPYYTQGFNFKKKKNWSLRGCVGEAVKQNSKLFREQLFNSLLGLKVDVNDSLPMVCLGSL